MSAPTRIQLRRTKGWRLPENTVVVARPSRWGNPYRLSFYQFERADGSPAPHDERAAREMAVRDFAHWLEVTMEGEGLAEAAWYELRGKNLACWCPLCEAHKSGRPLGVRCDDCESRHADVLLQLANEGKE